MEPHQRAYGTAELAKRRFVDRLSLVCVLPIVSDIFGVESEHIVHVVLFKICDGHVALFLRDNLDDLHVASEDGKAVAKKHVSL